MLHQIRHWHHTLSNVKPLINRSNINLNLLADVFFHVFDFAMTIIRIILLWRFAKRNDALWSSKTFFWTGLILIGIGLFDFVEGLSTIKFLGFITSNQEQINLFGI